MLNLNLEKYDQESLLGSYIHFFASYAMDYFNGSTDKCIVPRMEIAREIFLQIRKTYLTRQENDGSIDFSKILCDAEDDTIEKISKFIPITTKARVAFYELLVTDGMEMLLNESIKERKNG